MSVVETTPVREFTSEQLAEQFGGTETWWLRQRPDMVEAGALSKVGRKFFGRVSDIEKWILTQPPLG